MSYYKIKCGGIYIIEIGDYYYVGKSTSVFDRLVNHYLSLKLKKHHSPKLQQKFNEIGIEGLTFRVLEHISITDFKKTSGSKGKALNSAYNRLLLSKEKEWMGKFGIKKCLNNYDKWFKKEV
jgi:hypothetical protein